MLARRSGSFRRFNNVGNLSAKGVDPARALDLDYSNVNLLWPSGPPLRMKIRREQG
jgi:hypothetical protein